VSGPGPEAPRAGLGASRRPVGYVSARMATAVFIGFWVVVGLGLLFVSLRGGPRGAREALHGQSRTGRRLTAVGVAIVVAVFALIVPGVLLAGDANKAKYKSVELSSSEKAGRDVFHSQCSSCHTLKAADGAGKVGPNLDELKPPRSLVLDAVLHGRMRGQGTMPARVVTGTDAADVAAFVSKVAGR
jgi:mono/diheme cytochrome c family protein